MTVVADPIAVSAPQEAAATVRLSALVVARNEEARLHELSLIHI